MDGYIPDVYDLRCSITLPNGSLARCMVDSSRMYFLDWTLCDSGAADHEVAEVATGGEDLDIYL